LAARHVDQEDFPVAGQQVGGLDVAVGDPGVPQAADDGQGVPDRVPADLRIQDLLSPGEELGHQQVLPLGGELDEPVGGSGRDAHVGHQPQHVVLVLHPAAGPS
jgi:hypothetical protein